MIVEGTALAAELRRRRLGRGHNMALGGWEVNALMTFSKSFPLEYPEIEALVVLQRKAFRFAETPCRFRPRVAGRSSITPLKSIYYIVHVLLGVFVNVLKYERRIPKESRRS